MSDDLPTKLRYAADHIDGFRDEYLLEDAADRIEELEAENERLRDGLVDLRFGSDAELSAAIGRLLDHKETP